jgi:hypothetical protein
VRYVFPHGVNSSVLQIYSLPAVSVGVAAGGNASAFANASSAVGSIACAIRVLGAGTLVIDFGVETPGWVEFDSADLSAADAAALVLATSEYAAPDFVAAYKQGRPTVYGAACGGGRSLTKNKPQSNACTYRLETNPELYEGLRFAFLTLAVAPAQPFTITALRAVVQAKPVTYAGAFAAAGDPQLARIWSVGAFTVRATMQASYMGSILEDRGDRIAWTGDLHPTQLTAMAAFGNFDFVLANLNRSSCPDCCNGIATYCLYFVLSLCDYFDATGDRAALAALAPAASAKLDAAAALYADPRGLRFVGHDDRLGNGFCAPDLPECQAVYRLLAIRAWARFARALRAAALQPAAAARYANLSSSAVAALRAAPAQPWWAGFGVHAAA